MIPEKQATKQTGKRTFYRKTGLVSVKSQCHDTGKTCLKARNFLYKRNEKTQKPTAMSEL